MWGRLESIGWKNATEHNIEAVVRQQIHMDVLSREQGRLVRVVIVVQVFHGSTWRMFVPSSSTGARVIEVMKRRHERLDIVSTMPESIAALYWLGAPWLVRTFVENIMWLFPPRLHDVLQVFGHDYRDHLMNIVSSVSVLLLSYNLFSHFCCHAISHHYLISVSVLFLLVIVPPSLTLSDPRCLM
jgi:hypothetical protein